MSDAGFEAHAASSDHALMQNYRAGQQDAATELYHRYAERLRGLTRAELSPELARRVGVDDVVQSVFGSLFRGINLALYDVPAGEEIWKLILVIALHKIRNQGTYHHAAKRDTRRTVSANGFEARLQTRTDENQASAAFLRLVIDEALERLSACQRQMVQLRMDGFNVLEIAQQTGRSKRTVERLLQQARTILGQFLDEGK